MARMRWDKAAREKLKKEAALYDQSAFFIMRFGLTTRAQKDACINILNIFSELESIISLSYSVVKDYDEMLHGKRSKVEKELISVCDGSDDVQIKQAFEEFLVHFKQGDLQKYGIYSQYSPINAKTTDKGKKKRKAPQLTKLELQQQKDDDEKLKVYLEKQEKLHKESDYYEKTLLFMKSFLYTEQVVNEEQRNILLYAYKNVLAVDCDLQYLMASSKELFTNEEQRKHLLYAYKNILAVGRDLQSIIVYGKELSDQDLSLIVNEYRSKIENELQSFCDNVSNLTVKEAYARHLDDFKTGFKLSAQDHHSDLKNEDGKVMSSKTKMSVKKKSKLRKSGKGRSKGRAKDRSNGRAKDRSGSCKTPSHFDDIDPYMNEYLEMSHYDHSECCKKRNRMSDFERYIAETVSLQEEEQPSKQEYVVFDDICDDDSDDDL